MSSPLTLADLDEFAARLRATIAAAAEGDALRAAVAKLVATPSASPSHSPQRVPRAAAPKESATPPATEPAAAKPARPAKRRRQPNGTVTGDAVLAALRAAPAAGLAIRDLKATLGGGDQTIRRRLHELEQAGALRRTGTFSSTRYHAP